MAPASTYNGARLIVELLERAGVRVVAGIPGGALLPLYDALGESTRIRHILARHEQAAGFIAQGIARITRRTAVCLATSGPGVTNMVTALADAKLDSVPLLCIAGQVPTHLIGTDAFQEVPTIDMVRPITKACFFVRRPEELIELIPHALALTQSGRPGPVLIDVPKDVQNCAVTRPDFEALRPASADAPAGAVLDRCIESAVGTSQSAARATADVDSADAAALTDAFDAAASMIAAAKRPLLYVGGGVVQARAHTLVRQLAERASIPVTTTLMALGAVPAKHALSLGMLGMHGARCTNLAIDECDVLVAIGARFDDRATGRPDLFARRARIIHIDIDARELGKIKQPALAIRTDAAHALRELLQRTQRTQRPLWLTRIADLKSRYPLHTPQADRMCSGYGIVSAVGALAGGNAIVTTDVGQHQMWVAQCYPFARPDRWLTSGGLGTMGFGLPAAIGAALAEPRERVICFTGDGSLLMNIQELATLAELDLNVKVVVLDNAALGLVKQQQELFYRRRLVASQYEQPSNFAALARAFGVPAMDLGTIAAPHAALAQALQVDGPALIRVPIDAAQHVLPMVAPGAANTAALDHANIPLSSAVDRTT